MKFPSRTTVTPAICSAFFVPPAAVSACFSIFVPATEPSAIATTQNASHADTAVFQ